MVFLAFHFTFYKVCNLLLDFFRQPVACQGIEVLQLVLLSHLFLVSIFNQVDHLCTANSGTKILKLLYLPDAHQLSSWTRISYNIALTVGGPWLEPNSSSANTSPRSVTSFSKMYWILVVYRSGSSLSKYCNVQCIRVS